MGHSGHGLSGCRVSGGRGKISNWVKLLQPCRIEVPTQSVPVSPPPMTITCLSLAEMKLPSLMARVEQALGVGAEKLHRHINTLEFASRNRQIARLGRAGTDHDGVEFRFQFARRNVHADVGIGDELDAFRRHQIDAPLDDFLIELHVGNAVHEQSADAVRALVHGDQMAGAIELCGAGKPDGPEPITATFFPVRFSGGSAVTQPCAKPLSIIAHSIFLIVTGSSLMTQARKNLRRAPDRRGR